MQSCLEQCDSISTISISILRYFIEVFIFLGKISKTCDNIIYQRQKRSSHCRICPCLSEQNTNKTTTKIYFILWQKYVDVCWRWRTISVVVEIAVDAGCIWLGRIPYESYSNIFICIYRSNIKNMRWSLKEQHNGYIINIMCYYYQEFILALSTNYFLISLICYEGITAKLRFGVYTATFRAYILLHHKFEFMY